MGLRRRLREAQKGRASQPGSHMGQKVILLDMSAISEREYHFCSFYSSVMFTFEHYPDRISTRHALQPNQMRDLAGTRPA